MGEMHIIGFLRQHVEIHVSPVTGEHFQHPLGHRGIFVNLGECTREEVQPCSFMYPSKLGMDSPDEFRTGLLS